MCGTRIPWCRKLDYDIYDNLVCKGRTIREVAELANVSKSSIHLRIHSRAFIASCKYFNLDYDMLQEVLDDRFRFKYIKGGQQTRQKWIGEKKKNAYTM